MSKRKKLTGTLWTKCARQREREGAAMVKGSEREVGRDEGGGGNSKAPTESGW